MIVWGWGSRVKDNGPIAPMRCPQCGSNAHFHWVHTNKNFKLYWVPIIPYASQELLLCPICQAGMQVERTKLAIVQDMRQATREREAGTLSEGVYREKVTRFWSMMLDAQDEAPVLDVEPPPALPNPDAILDSSTDAPSSVDDPEVVAPTATPRVEEPTDGQSVRPASEDLSPPRTAVGQIPSPELADWLDLIGDTATPPQAVTAPASVSEPTQASSPSPEPTAATGLTTQSDRRPCPECGEPIRVAAIKCRWCGTWLEE